MAVALVNFAGAGLAVGQADSAARPAATDSAKEEPEQRGLGGLGAAVLPPPKPGTAGESPPTTDVAATRPAPTVPSGAPAVATPAATPAATAPAPPVAKLVTTERVPAKQPWPARGLPGVGLKPEQVNAAVDRGADFLWAHLKKNSMVADHGLGWSFINGYDLLACHALVHAGLHRRDSDFKRELERFLARVDPGSKGLEGTYETGVLAMLLESYDDPAHAGRLARATKRLVEQQGPLGTWTYRADVPGAFFDEAADAGGRPLTVLGGGDPDRPPPPPVELRRARAYDPLDDGDNSLTQFAALGLWAGARGGFRAPPEAWRRVAAATRANHCPDGGWSYTTAAHTTYGSMTCAGIVTLAIANHELGRPDPGRDERIEQGLGWLVRHFSVSENPNSASYLYYYLYSLERVGRVLDTEHIGPHEWYPLGARFLVDGQRADGSWVEKDPSDAVGSTSFALLFLTRATPTLAPRERPRGGRGELRTAAVVPPPPKLYVVLDCSGSMLAELPDGRAKFDVARDAVRSLLTAVPDGTQVALRAYGHRRRAGDADAETDSQLVVPFGPGSAAQVAAALDGLRARGKTPLTHSLTEAAGDLTHQAAGGRTVVLLLTDGGDDTRARGGAVAAAAAVGAVKEVALHVVGFGVDDADPAGQLAAMAARAGGTYQPAAGAGDLAEQLFAAALGRPSGFRVLDRDGREVHAGRFGQAMSVPEGRYKLTVQFAGRAFGQDVWVNTDRATSVLFDAAAARAAAPEPATPPASPPTPAPPPPPAPAAAGAGQAPARFCTSCGAKFTPSANFCTACGAKTTP